VSLLESTALRTLADVKSGGGAPQDPAAFSDNGHPFVRAGSLSMLVAGGHESSLEKISPSVAAAHGLKIFPAGTVLFAKSGMSATKGYIHQLKMPAYVVNHLAALVPHDPRDGSFLCRALERFSPTSLIRDQAYPSIRLGDIEGMELLAPRSIDCRVRIAAILDKADALRRKRKRALELLDGLMQSVFQTEVDADWPTQNIGEICTVVRGSSPRPQGDPRYFGGPVPRLMIADITRDGKYVTPCIDSLTVEGATKSRAMPSGSVVMAVSGAVGLPAILQADACIHDGFVGFRELSSEVLPSYLYEHLRANRSENQRLGAGAIWTNLTTDQVKAFQIPMPPLKMQQKLVARLSKVEGLAVIARRGIDETDTLFTSLQHRAFAGQL